MEKILEIILFVVFSLVTTLTSSYIIYVLSYIINKKDYPKKNILLGSLILLPFCVFNNFIMLNIQNIKFIMPLVAAIACIIVIMFIYKSKFTKTLLIILFYSVVTFLMDIILASILLILDKDISYITSNHKLQCLFGIIPNIISILIMLLIISIYKKKNLKLNLKENYKYILYQSIVIIVCLIPSMYLMFSNSYNYSIWFVAINAFQLIVVSSFSIIYLKKGIVFKDTELELENTKLHNKALSTINENIRGFKHDMGNMVQSINGYLAVGNIDGVKNYCKNLLHNFNDINLLSILSPKVINDPAIYGVVVSKMLCARDKNLTLSLDIGLNVENINFPSFELSRIIGILLDNAIEASLESDEKKLKLEMFYDETKKADVIVIGNSVKDPDKVDVIKMFEKNYSTKENPSGFGLYEVLKFLKKYNKGDIVPNIDYEKAFFTQTLTFDK